MDSDVVPFLLGIATLSTSLAVLYALGRWLRVSRSIPRAKVPASGEVTSGEVLRRLQELEADQVALSSTQEKLSTTVKRLTSRAGMRELRDRESDSSSAPPKGTSKADLLRHYGMSGKVGPDFARAQLRLEVDRGEHGDN
jgi:hypothetical protein